MSDHPCDATDCERPATQVGEVKVPVRPLEVRLCDEHVQALRAGKLREMSQDRQPHDGGYARPRLTFDP